MVLYEYTGEKGGEMKKKKREKTGSEVSGPRVARLSDN